MSTPPALKDAALEVEGRIAQLTLNRDDVRNALTGTGLIEDICATLEWANANPEISVLILTGAGAAFSAGGNIKTMRERALASSAAEMARYYRDGIQRIPRAMHTAKPPLAVRYAKRTLRLARHQGLEEHLESCASFQGALLKSEDHLEALAAFFDKRGGQYRGK